MFSIATSTYILLAIQLEEHDLVREFEETCEDYRRRVPKLIPFSKSRSAQRSRQSATVSAAR